MQKEQSITKDLNPVGPSADGATTRKVIASRQRVSRFTQRAASDNPDVIASLPRFVEPFDFNGRPRMLNFVRYGNDTKPTVCRSIGSTANGAWSSASFFVKLV
jgi:hypothetical protein